MDIYSYLLNGLEGRAGTSTRSEEHYDKRDDWYLNPIVNTDDWYYDDGGEG